MTDSLTMIVPTVQGREHQLSRLLDSLVVQADEIEEIVVVCRGPMESRAPAPQGLADRVLFMQVEHGGASMVRNAGWERAGSALLGFADDDCWYPHDLCRRVRQFFEQEPRTDILCGSVHDPRTGERLAATPLSKVVLGKRQVVHSCIGPALWVRRASLGDLRFDETIGTGSAGPWQSDEEPDLVLRAMLRGCRAVYDPAFFVWHHVPDFRRDWRTVAGRAYRYGMGRGRFLAVNRYPAIEVASGIGRSLAGAALFAAQGRFGKSWCYLHTFAGRIAGYMAGRREGKSKP